MSNNPTSPFQTIDWQIIDFSYNRGVLYLPAEIIHQWTLHAHIERLDNVENSLRAVVDIKFKMIAESDDGVLTLNGQCLTLCSLVTESVDNAEALFEKITKTSAMVNSLANLRVFLMQQGALLQIGPKRVMLPFINLNNFQFDQDIVFTA